MAKFAMHDASVKLAEYCVLLYSAKRCTEKLKKNCIPLLRFTIVGCISLCACVLCLLNISLLCESSIMVIYKTHNWLSSELLLRTRDLVIAFRVKVAQRLASNIIVCKMLK